MPSRMPALLYCAVRVHGHVRVFYDVRAVVHVHVPCYDGRVSVRVRVSSVLHTCWPRSRALHPHATAHPHVVTPAPAPAPLPARRKNTCTCTCTPPPLAVMRDDVPCSAGQLSRVGSALERAPVFDDVRAVVHVPVPVLRRASERARACVISAAYLLAPGHAHCTRTRPCECSS